MEVNGQYPTSSTYRLKINLKSYPKNISTTLKKFKVNIQQKNSKFNATAIKPMFTDRVKLVERASARRRRAGRPPGSTLDITLNQITNTGSIACLFIRNYSGCT
ncbi:hypothetical protein EVAR_103703_1 [Eumeta japonica]|uniref:Uncharacterized protein n=1 Tax=Eumeta variegata TaxID=151549 RepID=A0A4C1ZH32_EUMVA|nr:hypothetical protein EVAR_103703_1 [Eumeta japonica]